MLSTSKLASHAAALPLASERPRIRWYIGIGTVPQRPHDGRLNVPELNSLVGLPESLGHTAFDSVAARVSAS